MVADPAFYKKKFTINSATSGGHLKIILGPEFEFELTNLQKESSKQEFKHTNFQMFKSTGGFLDVEASD